MKWLFRFFFPISALHADLRKLEAVVDRLIHKLNKQ